MWQHARCDIKDLSLAGLFPFTTSFFFYGNIIFLFTPIFGNTTGTYNKTMVYLNNNAIEQIKQKKNQQMAAIY